MLLYMYEQNIVVYAMLFLFGVGILTKIILSLVYRQLVKASQNMGASENKLMKLMRIRFDTCYKIKLGVHNVDSFVDKYVYSHKICGISLYTWENLSGQINIICLLFTMFAGGGALILHCGQDILLSTFITGIGSVIMLIALEKLFGISAKQKIMRVHMKDFLENNLKVKLENEYFLSEEMEEYRNNYFSKEETVKDTGKRVRQKAEKAAEKIAEKEAEQSLEKAAAVSSAKEEDEKIIEEILKEYLV